MKNVGICEEEKKTSCPPMHSISLVVRLLQIPWADWHPPPAAALCAFHSRSAVRPPPSRPNRHQPPQNRSHRSVLRKTNVEMSESVSDISFKSHTVRQHSRPKISRPLVCTGYVALGGQNRLNKCGKQLICRTQTLRCTLRRYKTHRSIERENMTENTCLLV